MVTILFQKELSAFFSSINNFTKQSGTNVPTKVQINIEAESPRTHRGTEEPPRVPGLMRLYIMAYCPYALRPRLVLKAKELPHDEVRINLFRKPEWYFKLHPEGKVPTLLDGEKVIVESLDVCDYLESTYPQNPLYPSDPVLKAKDKEIVFSKIDPAANLFNRIMFGTRVKTPEEWIIDIVEVLQPLEAELSVRGSLFFGGDKPMMVDLMLWPWAEAAEVLNMKLGQKLPLANNQLPQLRKWRKAMFNHPVCQSLAHENAAEKFFKIAQTKITKEEPDYDNVLGSSQAKL